MEPSTTFTNLLAFVQAYVAEVIRYNDTATVAGAKRPFEADGNTSESPSTRAKTEEGPSTLKLIAKPLRPEHLPDEVLLVVPPMPKSLYEELTDSSLTEPESSENERDIRKAEMKASN